MPMIDHVSIGVRDIKKSQAFYDAALQPLGYRRLDTGETSLGYGKDSVSLWLGLTDRPVQPDDKSGLHICFSAPTREGVDRFHEAALKAGGKDNGKPGRRTEYSGHYYAAFVVDPDGYRIEAYCGKT